MYIFATYICLLQTALQNGCLCDWFLHVITATVGELEACKLQHLATIEDLKKELVTLKQRSVELEQNKETFEADHNLRTCEQDIRLQSLQKV